ncbi:cell division protein ZapE [Nocardia sp. NPDC051570]|uniref:cell division protein ZapE n=1 Tax=Nocardia sp. NPDC051570 TaxID=3364324 RepID=UPI0037989277
MLLDELILDDRQRAAAARLRTVAERIGKRWRRPGGVYLHGPAGRGKTMVMNDFFAGVRSNRKRRWHFHEFFADLHAESGAAGSFEAGLAAMVGDAELVCFDEFHVHDIGDAMFIARLLDRLFARRVTVVVTSNYPPEELLSNPLWHERFAPTIERIRAHMAVVAVDGPRDYRGGGAHRAGFSAGRYIVGAASIVGAVEMPVGHGWIRARAVTEDAIIIDFDQLCGNLLSAADFLQMSRRFRRWTLCAVPPLRTVPMDWGTRFVNLVDILYDADSELTLYAETAREDLTRDVAAVRDLYRTASRLRELVVV